MKSKAKHFTLHELGAFLREDLNFTRREVERGNRKKKNKYLVASAKYLPLSIII